MNKEYYLINPLRAQTLYAITGFLKLYSKFVITRFLVFLEPPVSALNDIKGKCDNLSRASEENYLSVPAEGLSRFAYSGCAARV